MGVYTDYLKKINKTDKEVSKKVYSSLEPPKPKPKTQLPQVLKPVLPNQVNNIPTTKYKTVKPAQNMVKNITQPFDVENIVNNSPKQPIQPLQSPIGTLRGTTANKTVSAFARPAFAFVKGMENTATGGANFLKSVAYDKQTKGKYSTAKTKFYEAFSTNYDRFNTLFGFSDGLKKVSDTWGNASDVPEEFKQLPREQREQIINDFQKDIVSEKTYNTLTTQNKAYDDLSRMAGESIGAMVISSLYGGNAPQKAVSLSQKIVRALSPTGTTGMMSLNIANEKYNKLRGENVPIGKAVVNALGSAYMSAITEKMGYSDLASVQRLGTNLSQSFGKNLLNAGTKLIINSTSEGFEEVLNNIGEGFIDKAIINKDLPLSEIFDPAKNTEAFFGGALVGMLVGGGATVAQLKTIKTNSQNIADKVNLLNTINEDLPDKYQLKPLENATIKGVEEYQNKLQNNINTFKNEVKSTTNKVIDTKVTQEIGLQSTETQKASNVSPLIEKINRGEILTSDDIKNINVSEIENEYGIKLDKRNRLEQLNSISERNKINKGLEQGQKNFEALSSNPNIVEKSPEQINQDKTKANDIASKLGVKINWYNNENAPKKIYINKNGVYDNGQIFINENAKNPYNAVLGHELFHRVDTETRKGIIEFIKGNTNQDSQGFIQYKQDMENSYKSENLELSDDLFWEEFAAENMENFFTDENYVKRLAKKDRNLLQKIYDYIMDLINKIKGTDYTGKLNEAGLATGMSDVDLNKVAKMYRDALNSQKSTKSTETKYSTQGNSILNDDDVANVLMTIPQKQKDTLADRIKDEWDYFSRKWIDSGKTIDTFGKITGDTYLYSFYNNARSVRTQAMYMIETEQRDINSKVVGKGLLKIFEPILKKDSLYQEEFSLYLLHNHNIDRMAQDKPVFSEKVTADMSRQEVAKYESKHPEFKRIANEIYKYTDNLLKYQVDTGLISQETYDYDRKTYPHYVPTYRDNKGMKINPTIRGIRNVNKKAKGSNLDILPLLTQLEEKTMQVVSNGRINMLGNRILQNVMNNPDKVGKYVSSIAKGEGVKNSFVIYQNGEPITLYMNEGMLEGFASLGLTTEEIKSLNKAVLIANRGFKSFITSYNPMFAINNFARDIFDAIGFYSENSGKFIKNYPKAVAEIKNNGELWRLYQSLGGFSSSILNSDTGEIKKSIISDNILTNSVEKANYIIEQLPRFTEFITVVEKGGRSNENLMKAMLASANVTVNFNRSGTIAKQWNKYLVPFFNASIQGTSNIIRVATGQKGFKQWLGLVVKAGLLGVFPSWLNRFIYRDDEEYQDLPQRVKDTYFLFKWNGEFLRLPKGRVMSVIGMLGNLKGRDTDESFKTMLDQIAPLNPLTNTIASPVILANMNKTWYGADLENQRLQGYKPSERYDTSTDMFSRALGKALNYSPKKINYLLDSYTGVIGDFILPLMTPKAQNNPIKKAFTIDPVMNSKISNDFYKQLDELTFAKNSEDTVENNVVFKYLNSHTGVIRNLNKEIREIEASKLSNKDKMEKVREIKATINGIQKNALNNLEAYKENVNKIIPKSKELDKQIDEVYLKANKETFGAEYAIQKYNKDIYEKAKKAKRYNVSYDDFYEVYFSIKDIETLKNSKGETIKTKTEQQREIIKGLKISKRSKEILDELLINDVTIIPKDITVDYSTNETFTLTQMSEAAQKKWERVKGRMSYQDYEKYYSAYSQGKTKAEKISKLMNAGMTGVQANSFYNLISKK